MTEKDLRRQLDRIEIPDEHAARERAWEVVRTAHAEREPVPWPRRRIRPLLALAAAGAIVAAAVSPPGRALLGSVRDAIGVERADEALFSLPTDGRLLVDSPAGPWIVQPDGSRRLLGDYREASWSPFGRFVIAARPDELAALEPDGDVRWKLARPAVRFPRWGGTRIDTRIAYLSGSELRVVAGDGDGDTRLDARVAPVAPAWRPRARHVLAYVDADGRVRIVDAETRRTLLRARERIASPVALAWSPTGNSLVVLSRRAAHAVLGTLDVRLEGAATAIAPDPRGERFAVAVRLPDGGSRVELLDGGARSAFAGPGQISGIEWSPDGRWLLVEWADADQWVFIRISGRRRIEAASRISAQFEGSSFPSVAGWCCP